MEQTVTVFQHNHDDDMSTTTFYLSCREVGAAFRTFIETTWLGVPEYADQLGTSKLFPTTLIEITVRDK